MLRASRLEETGRSLECRIRRHQFQHSGPEGCKASQILRSAKPMNKCTAVHARLWTNHCGFGTRFLISTPGSTGSMLGSLQVHAGSRLEEAAAWRYNGWPEEPERVLPIRTCRADTPAREGSFIFGYCKHAASSTRQKNKESSEAPWLRRWAASSPRAAPAKVPRQKL